MTQVDPRRRVPRTDVVLAQPRIVAAVARLGRPLVKDEIGVAQDRARTGAIDPDDVVDAVLAGLPATATVLRPAVNATEVLLDTNLGRAPFSAAARAALDVAAGACDVELDLATGARGRRGAGVVDALLAAVPGAGAGRQQRGGSDRAGGRRSGDRRWGWPLRGSTAVPARVRPLGSDTVRLRLDRPLRLRIGDRAVLRDPGRRAPSYSTWRPRRCGAAVPQPGAATRWPRWTAYRTPLPS